MTIFLILLSLALLFVAYVLANSKVSAGAYSARGADLRPAEKKAIVAVCWIVTVPLYVAAAIIFVGWTIEQIGKSFAP